MNKQKNKIFLIIGICLMAVFAFPSIKSEAAKVKLNKTKETLYVGKTVNLKVKGTSKKAKWSTKNKKVATVSQKGKVTAKKAGKTTITAKIGKKKYNCKITVKNPVLNKKAVSLTVGKTYQLKLSNIAKKISWGTDNKKIATINSKGLITAKGAGKTKVYAKYNSKKYYCSITVTKATSNSEEDNWKYKINGKTVTITGYKGKSFNITVPSKLGGYPVTTIGDGTFSGQDEINNVTIPNGITSIGENAFYGCDHLKSVKIPNSVTSIGESAFRDCEMLMSISIPYGVTSIGDETFRACKMLTNITIPNSVKSIGSSAFDRCESLTNIVIPNSVTTIGGDAFLLCTNLKSVTISNKLTCIGSGVFYNCDSLVSVTVPNSVTRIESQAFGSCDSLTSIIIPSSVTYIAEDIFFQMATTELTLKGSTGSYAETFAKKNGIAFQSL